MGWDVLVWVNCDNFPYIEEFITLSSKSVLLQAFTTINSSCGDWWSVSVLSYFFTWIGLLTLCIASILKRVLDDASCPSCKLINLQHRHNDVLMYTFVLMSSLTIRNASIGLEQFQYNLLWLLLLHYIQDNLEMRAISEWMIEWISLSEPGCHACYKNMQRYATTHCFVMWSMKCLFMLQNI